MNTDWQPIKTAPRETELLVGKFVNGEWRICQSSYCFDIEFDIEDETSYWYWHCDFDKDGVVTDDLGPTHWMPLPVPPSAPPLDIESMLAECVPGGSTCDPKVIADNIRNYFATKGLSLFQRE